MQLMQTELLRSSFLWLCPTPVFQLCSKRQWLTNKVLTSIREAVIIAKGRIISIAEISFSAHIPVSSSASSRKNQGTAFISLLSLLFVCIPNRISSGKIHHRKRCSYFRMEIKKHRFLVEDSTKFNGVSLFTFCFVPDNQEASYLCVF